MDQPMDADDTAKMRILAFAREKMLRDGFAHITVEQIASEMGISKKTFYKAFQGKDALIAGIMESVMQEIRGKLEEVIQSDNTFTEKLHAVMRVIAEQLCKIGRPFQQDLQRFLPEFWRRVEEFRRKTMSANMGRMLEQGIREGAVRSDVNVRIFLFAYLAAIDSLLRPDVLAQESFSMQEALGNIMAIFFHGILTEEASRELDQYQHNNRSQIS